MSQNPEPGYPRTQSLDIPESRAWMSQNLDVPESRACLSQHPESGCPRIHNLDIPKSRAWTSQQPQPWSPLGLGQEPEVGGWWGPAPSTLRASPEHQAASSPAVWHGLTCCETPSREGWVRVRPPLTPSRLPLGSGLCLIPSLSQQSRVSIHSTCQKLKQNLLSNVPSVLGC